MTPTANVCIFPDISVTEGALVEIVTFASNIVSVSGLGVTWKRRHAVDFGIWKFSGEVPADAEGDVTVTFSGGDEAYWRIQQWTGQQQGANGDNAYAQTGLRNVSQQVGVNIAAFSAPENRANFTTYALFSFDSVPANLTLSANLTERGRVTSGDQFFFLMGDGPPSASAYAGDLHGGGTWVFEGLFSEMVAAT